MHYLKASTGPTASWLIRFTWQSTFVYPPYLSSCPLLSLHYHIYPLNLFFSSLEVFVSQHSQSSFSYYISTTHSTKQFLIPISPIIQPSFFPNPLLTTRYPSHHILTTTMPTLHSFSLVLNTPPHPFLSSPHSFQFLKSHVHVVIMHAPMAIKSIASYPPNPRTTPAFKSLSWRLPR